MKFPRTAIGAAAGSLALAPIAVSAQGAPNDGDRGSDLARAAIIVAIAGAGMGVLLLTDDDDDERPISG
ncbi:MAG: hypothetical protein V2I43_11680 [Parvularcula sp.]|jgi:uncharacterized membrane protein YidH (DUF202 family)|nr:hypothetical protein [Parvularcula sp.]